MPSTDLRERLRRMGAIGIAPKFPRGESETVQTMAPLPGRVIETISGPCQLIQTQYSLSECHGEWTLGDFLRCSSLTASRLAHTNHHRDLDLSSMAFLDTETTGLSGGAGTLAFLVGVGTFAGGEFILRQFFLRDPVEELGMLSELADLLSGCSGVTTFNGLSFDVPLLTSRFTMNRCSNPFQCLWQFDLLHPARRLWRGRTTACSLGALEQEMLGIVRGGDDVSGRIIPRIYAQYLYTGYTHDISRVLYHNTVDILSMVTLATHLLHIFTDPLSESRSGTDCLRLGTWLEDNGQSDQAESAYRASLTRSLPEDQRSIALHRLAAFLKRANRRVEALPLWEQLADLMRYDPSPCVELAKYFEWHARCLQPAVDWTERALGALEFWPTGLRRDEHLLSLEHRLQRLHRKLAKVSTRQNEHI